MLIPEWRERDPASCVLSKWLMSITLTFLEESWEMLGTAGTLPSPYCVLVVTSVVPWERPHFDIQSDKHPHALRGSGEYWYLVPG